MKKNKTFIKDSMTRIRNQKKKDQNTNTKNRKKKTNMQFFGEHREKKKEKKRPLIDKPIIIELLTKGE